MQAPAQGFGRPPYEAARAHLLLHVVDLVGHVVLGPGDDLLGCHPVADGFQGLAQVVPCLLDVSPHFVRITGHV
jgi:hypothetical protein